MLSDYFSRKKRWLEDLPARTTLKLFNQRHVRTRLGRRYDAALDRHRPTLPRLDGLDAQILAGLDSKGVFVTSLESLALPGGEAITASAAMLADRYAGEARTRAAAGEPFMIVPPAWIAREDPAIYLWGLQDRLLDIAHAYIGLPPAYDGVAINYTVADGREVSTRMWHRDWEDRRMLKVAVYLHEVDAQGGPFQIIARHDSGQVDAAGFRYDLAGDADLAERLGPSFTDDIVTCTGSRGTVIFNDTARFFHRGKPAVTRDRAALFYSYFARRPRHPFLCERTGMTREDIARLARPLPERQRRTALWREHLPLPLKLIPPARL
ncbi:MAG: hypothetical protein ABW203_05155 [Novosphingobium sp.]